MEEERNDALADAIRSLAKVEEDPFAELVLAGVRRRLALTDAPRLVDRFVLGEPLGAGGMGVVYAADDPRLERRVALKLVYTYGPEGAERGLREARALARLSHPNVVTVYEAGVHEGRVFVAMELVEGQTLREWLRTTRSWPEICEVMLAAGRGLCAAHAAGIVHRDFKPDNVLVGERVRVADFGLAQDIDHDLHPSEPRATTHQSGGPPTGRRLLGTFAFMAPEQLRGEPFDARTDQFAFCATMVGALTGRPPFESDTPEERLEAIERGLPRGLPAGVPRWLRAMLGRGLRSSPEQRYPRLDDLLDAMTRHLRPRRRIGAVVATLAALGASAFTWWSADAREATCRETRHAVDEVWNPTRRDALATAFEATGKPYAEHAITFVSQSLDRYASDWADARVDACRAEQAGRASSRQIECLERRRGELQALLTQLEPTVAEPLDAEVVQRASQVVSALPPPSDCTHADALDDVSTVDDHARARLVTIREELARAWALAQVGRYAQGSEAIEPLIPELRAIGHEATLAEALLQRGRIDIRRGTLDDAHRSLWEALQLGLAIRADRIVASAAQALCDELTTQGELVRAHEAAEIAATMHQRLTGELTWPLLANLRGGLLVREHRDAEAVEVLAEGIAASDEDDPGALGDLLSMYGNQTAALLRLGRLDEAEQASEQAQAIARRLIGEDHPMFAILQIGSAAILDARGNADEALRVQQRGLELWQRAVPEPTPVTASMIYNNGLYELSLGRHEQALTTVREALALWERLLPPGHSRLAYAHTAIGRALHGKGALTEALEHHEQALRILEQDVARGEPMAGEPLLRAAQTALAAAQRGRADVWIEQGLRICETTVNPVMEGELRFVRARSLAERGEAESAEREAVAALELLRGAQASEAREVAAWLGEHRAAP